MLAAPTVGGRTVLAVRVLALLAPYTEFIMAGESAMTVLAGIQSIPGSWLRPLMENSACNFENSAIIPGLTSPQRLF
jgi:hypothetical protein